MKTLRVRKIPWHTGLFPSLASFNTGLVQIVMIRLQRVTLLALHQYLGLGAELIASQHRGTKNLKYRIERTESQSGEGADVVPPQPSVLQIQISSKGRLNKIDSQGWGGVLCSAKKS